MSTVVTDILQGLNPPQREAVETLDGPLLILAGAGSGKTRVVTRRIANLINHGVRPWEILAITFTNKAAGEMRQRVETLVGQSGVWLSTFHSFCARILRREAPVLGFSQTFTIYDEDDAQKVIKTVIEKLGIDDKRMSPGALRTLISGFKSKALAPEDLEIGTFHERIAQQVYQEYQAALTRNQALDFDDLLLKALVLFRDHTEVRERYRQRFRHVLVDEYQDTNGCQYQLVKLLGEGHRNVCVTGDPDQSIYSWRGADVRNILSFERDFPDTKVVRLEQNYRSTQNVLALASAVIKHNKERKAKELWTENPAGEPPALRIVGDQDLEAYEVVSEIERLIGTGRRYSDIAVFYRTNAQSRPFEQSLIRSAIPYQLIGGTPFYERREVKDALAYLRLVVNPKDDVSFARIVNVPRRGIGESSTDLIARKATDMSCSMLETLDRTEWMEKELAQKARNSLYAFARMLDVLRQQPRYPVADLVKRMLNDSGLLDSLRESGEDERLKNIEQLINAAVTYDAENEPGKLMAQGPPPEPGAFDGLDEIVQMQASVSGFLENAALMTPQDARKNSEDVVTLMTLHMAKGLEFPFVFIAGVEEGLLPMVRVGSSVFGAEQSAQDEQVRASEEERRLFYVGATRAKERLFLLMVRRRLRFGKYEVSIPSRFLDEIPENLIEETDRAGAGWDSGNFQLGNRVRSSFGGNRGRIRPGAAFEELDEFDATSAPGKKGRGLAQYAASAQEHSNDDFSQLNDTAFEIGDRVKHASFGEGSVEAIQGLGLSAKVQVHFREHGPKWLMLSIAKLRKV